MAATQEDILREAALNRIRQLGSATLQKELLYAPLKREIIKTLHDNALLRQTLMRPLMQIYKQRLLREDHTPAATLIENLTAAINLVTVYDHPEQKLEECDLFIEKIEAIDNLLQSGKANFKLEIIKFLKENDINPETIMEYIGSTARSLAGRTGHTPTDALITGLNRLNQRPELDTATSHKCFEYSEQLAFIKNSKDINNRIVEYLNTTQFSHLLNFKDKIIPSLENLNLLLQDQVKPSLQTLQDIKKKQALIERLELLKERMKEAAENKASLSDLEQKARQFSELLIDNDRLKPANEFSKSINKIVDSKNQEIDLTDKRIATIEQEIDKNKKELETKNKELSDADSHIATVFGNINDSSITDELKDEIELLQREREAHANDIHILTRRIKEKEDERDTLEKEREELQQYTSQLDVIKGYCVSNIEQIMLTQDQIRKEWAFHEELNTFAVYIKDGDSILATLQKVASYLCGGNDQTHAIGKINILLLIGAGVKAGPDLGLIEISAEIRLTIIIKGQLSVMDDRRVSFSYKLGLHLSCESSFRLGVDDSIEQYIAAASEYTGALKPPTSLLDAAAKAGVNMYEKETFHVYNSVSHWSHRWSDRINKRINFLNKYKSGTRQIIHSPEMARVLDSRPEQKSQIITAFGKHEESMALANQPSLQIIFENKTLLTTEGQLSLADRPVTEKSTQRSHTFEMYQTQENLNPPSWLSATDIFSDKRNVLGSIYESYTDFEYKKDEATIKGWSLYHKLLQSGKQQEFLEVYQNKYASFNFVGIELVSVDKMAIPKMGAEKYLQASVLLNQIANDKLRSSDSDAESRTEEIVFPEDLENSQLFFPSKESTKAFKQVVNLQISSITSGGKSTAFINEIKEGSENASKKIESIQSNLSGINQRFGTDFFASLSTSLEPVKEGFNEISEFLAQYDTGPTLGVYLRYTTQPYYIFSSQNPVILQNPWSTKPCAQVFRAISLKKISFSQEASIPVLPFLSVTLKGQVEFLHETSQYELLGLETFSYLKSIAPSVISDYIDLHIQEVLIILQQVTNYRSGCFQELAYEMESPDIHQEVKKSIVHLGIACFHTFSPRQQCPFSIPWQYSSNFSLLPNNNTLPDIEKKLNNLSNHIKGDYRAIGIESQMNFSRNLGSLWNQWNNNQDRRGMLIAKYKVNFFKSVTNQNILSNESDGSKKDLSDKIIADKNYTDFVSDFNALLMQQPSLDKKISSIMRSSASDFQKQILMNEVFKYVAEGPRSLGCFVSLLDLEKTIASLLDYRHQSVVSNTPRTLRGLWDITDDSDTITGWGAVWLHFSKRIGGLNPDPYLYNFEGQKPLVPNVVPKDTEWQADRGLNMFHGAWWGESAATEALKKSLLSFHNELAKNEMIFSHQMKIKGVGRDIDKYIEVKRYILQRIMLADNLDGSIQAWKKNKSDETSKRMANVVMQVEIPLLYDLDRLILVYCLNEILWLLREQSESSSPDVASLGSDQIRLLKATLIQYLQHFADESATHAVVHGVKQWIVPL